MAKNIEVFEACKELQEIRQGLVYNLYKEINLRLAHDWKQQKIADAGNCSSTDVRCLAERKNLIRFSVDRLIVISASLGIFDKEIFLKVKPSGKTTGEVTQACQH